MRSLSILATCALAAFAQTEPTGAKVLIAPQAPIEGASKVSKPFYYLTIVNPSGSEERVPATYTFPGKSKAYLNVVPEWRGHLAVFYGATNEPAGMRVYDWAHATEGNDRDLVLAGENIKIPLWFDDKPGQTAFGVALVKEDASSKEIVVAIHARRTDTAVQLNRFLQSQPGGKAFDPRHTNELDVQEKPFVTYAAFTLHNR